MIDVVSEEASDSSETLHELVAFLTLVSDELDDCSVVLVIVTEPLSQWVCAHYLQVKTGLRVFEVLVVLLLG